MGREKRNRGDVPKEEVSVQTGGGEETFKEKGVESTVAGWPNSGETRPRNQEKAEEGSSRCQEQKGSGGWLGGERQERKAKKRGAAVGGGSSGSEKVLCCVDYCVFVIWNGISCRYSISCP